MSALSDLEHQLGLPAFDISFFQETKIDTFGGTETSVPPKVSSSEKTAKKDKTNKKNKEEQPVFSDIMSESQNSRIDRMLKYIQ